MNTIRTMKSVLTALCGSAILLLCFCQTASATLGMKPQIKELKMTRGGFQEFYFTVSNHGEESMSLVMVAEPMDVTSDGQPFTAAPDFIRGCEGWITFEPEAFTLEPEQSLRVFTRVRAPKDVVGSYFAIVRCVLSEEQLLDLDTGETTATTLGLTVGVGSLIFVTTSSSQNIFSLQPDSLRLWPGETSQFGPVAGSEEGGWQLQVAIVNEGNIYTQAWGETSVYTQAGRLIEKADLRAGRGFVFPDRARIFTAKGSRPLNNGAYLVRVTVFSRDGKSGRGSFPFTVLDGVAYTGTDSEELNALLKASSPGFSLSERFIEFDVMPGSRRTKGVTVYNNRPDTLALTHRLMEWVVDSDGKISLLNRGEKAVERTCAGWLNVSPDTLVIPPGRRKNVKIQATAPEELDGSYYAGIRFVTKGSSEELPTEFQMPSALLVAASYKKTLNPSASLPSILAKKADSQECLFEVTFLNDGNVHCYADGEIEIYNVDGDKIGEPVKFGRVDAVIFPGVSKVYSVPWQSEIEPGHYRAYVKVGYRQDTSSIMESIPFDVN